MNNKSKRILWLLNHKTLRGFEVELLISLGFEVFTPKIIPSQIVDLSCNNDNAYDHSLTLPAEVLHKLNQHDFYMTPLEGEIKTLVNDYFDIAICAFFPYLLLQFVYQFQGKILLRAFGLENGATYSKRIFESYCPGMLHYIQQNKHRIWFAEAYENMACQEDQILNERAVYLPIGLPKALFEHQNSWQGTTNKVLFFCPRIKSMTDYYGKIYQRFKMELGHLPHAIVGDQPLPVADPMVIGYQPDSSLLEMFRDFKVMFYHGEERFHIHYHPLEAILFGMPVIYLKGGLLDVLLGEGQAGACNNYREARRKIRRILGNDVSFIETLKQQQAKILELFSWNYNYKIWTENFIGKVVNQTRITSPLSKKSKLKIAVFLPHPYWGGTINGAKNVAKMLTLGSRECGDSIEVVFSCVSDHYNLKETFNDLLEMKINLRETKWGVISKEKVAMSLQIMNQTVELTSAQYSIPHDGICDFLDCDFWLIISDRTGYPIAPLKPYAIFTYDFIQRYVPEILPDDVFELMYEQSSVSSLRQAKFLLTTTPQTKQDLINYVGVAPYKIKLIPMEFDPYKIEPAKLQIGDYFIWPTNLSNHKNHLKALEALNHYYTSLNGSFKVMLTGFGTELFESAVDKKRTHPYHTKIITSLAKYPNLRSNLIAKGNLPLVKYIESLANAKFLWHPAIIDNGTFSVIEAAYYRVPSLSSNYPQMKHINDRFNLNLTFFNSHNTMEMAHILKEMERDCIVKKSNLPPQSHFEQFSFEKLALDFWKHIRDQI